MATRSSSSVTSSSSSRRRARPVTASSPSSSTSAAGRSFARSSSRICPASSRLILPRAAGWPRVPRGPREDASTQYLHRASRDAELLVHRRAPHRLGRRNPSGQQLLVGAQHARGFLLGLAHELHAEAAYPSL